MSLTPEQLDDYITYTLSFVWLILVIISLVRLFLEIRRYRQLKEEYHQNLPTPPQFDTPLNLRPTPLPTSHSVSSLSHVYMENGILNVRLGNPRIISVSPSHRDWNNPSAFLDRPIEPPHRNRHIPTFVERLTKLQIDNIAPVLTFVNNPNADNPTCVICLDPIHHGHRIRNLPCAHSFHAKCILIWLQRANRCPCCAKPIIAPPSHEILKPPKLESPEPRAFGLGDAIGPGEERQRHQPLWSFSNRRSNSRRARNESRARNHRTLRQDFGDVTDATTGRPALQSAGFEEILEVDHDDGQLHEGELLSN